jgi:hypothetical protein
VHKRGTGQREYLGLVLQAPEGRREYDPVKIALEARAGPGWYFIGPYSFVGVDGVELHHGLDIAAARYNHRFKDE